MPVANAWLVRHSTALIMGAGALLFFDSRVTNVLVDAPDLAFDRASEDDTPRVWREYVEAGGSVDKARGELERLHGSVRARLAQSGAPRPDGLDPLLAALRERVDERVYLEAEEMDVDAASFAAIATSEVPGVRVIPIAEHLARGDWSCARGMSKAFAVALGEDTLDVTTPDGFDAAPTPTSPRIALSWRASASGVLYGSGDKRLFPGFTVAATVRLTAGDATLAEVEATVDPGPDIEVTSFGSIPASMFDGDHGDVADGMIEGACQRLGERLIGEMTGWAPPAAGGDSQEKKCEDGDAAACLAVGEALREKDPARALELLRKGCNGYRLHGGEACLAAAELSLLHPEDPQYPTSLASILLDDGCDGHHALACARGAELDLERAPGEEPASPYAQAEAYLKRLRACDLGYGPACAAAASQAQSGSGQENAAPSPVRAMLLATAACAKGGEDWCEAADAMKDAAQKERTIFGVELAEGEQVIDVRWGMWIEGKETEVVWIAGDRSRSDVELRVATLLGTHRARIYEPTALPPGPRAPAEARTIYALARAPQLESQHDRPCPDCTPEAYSQPFWPMMCKCLPP
jgi:hypothetical protein